jgi:prepilin-type N-terminal cleavage/methylation domain-containing protein
MTLHRPRPAFTLIELLVVMGIMVIIATLGFLFLPNLNKNKGVPNATTQFEGWARLSKGQALKDGSPRGIRLIDDGGGKVTTLQYIEQPDPIAPRGQLIRAYVSTINPNMMGPPPYPNPMPTTVDLVLLDPMTGQPTAGNNWDDPINQQIAAGDFFELNGSPSVVARVTSVGPSPTFPGQQRVRLTLDRSIDGTDVSPLLLADGFRVVRAPRPLQGEPMLQMHKDVYIDLSLSNPFPQYLIAQGYAPSPETNGYSTIASWSPSSNNLDILFNSSGQVANASTGQIMLTLVHVDRPTDRLVVIIYTRTGKITAVNWNDVPGSDPFLLARDGKASGL